MDFGVATVTRGECATREGYIAVAEAAERLGFGFISVNDHVVVPRDIASRYPYSESGEWAARTAGECLDQLNTLAFIAARTERLRLLTSVMVVPQRHPVLTAKMLATIDVLSKGRLIVGCGVGWMKEEFEALGAPPFAERGSATDEYLDAISAALEGPIILGGSGGGLTDRAYLASKRVRVALQGHQPFQASVRAARKASVAS